MTETCTDVSFEEIVAGGVRWQRWLVRQWRGLIPDLEAELTACLWEQYRAGVREQGRLFAAALTALRRVSRGMVREVKVRARAEMSSRYRLLVDDPFDRVVDRVVAEQLVAGVEVPARSQAWVRVMTVGGRAEPQAMEAGRRWANRVRRDLRAQRCA